MRICIQQTLCCRSEIITKPETPRLFSRTRNAELIILPDYNTHNTHKHSRTLHIHMRMQCASSSSSLLLGRFNSGLANGCHPHMRDASYHSYEHI